METITAILKYFFSPAPGHAFQFYNILLTISILLIIAGIVFSTIYKKRKKTDFAFKRLFKKVPTILVIFGILILFLIAVRYENIPYFSMRIFLYITLLVFLYFIYRYIKIAKVDYPREKENVRLNTGTGETKHANVYLPNKNKR